MRKALSLPGNLGFLEELFCFKYDLFGVPENGVHPADDEYEKDNIWGLPRLKRFPRTAAEITQIKETILLLEVWSIGGAGVSSAGWDSRPRIHPIRRTH
jgi:hypothetical protein